jgi:hypothetical protein
MSGREAETIRQRRDRLRGQPQEGQHSAAAGGTQDRLPPARGAVAAEFRVRILEVWMGCPGLVEPRDRRWGWRQERRQLRRPKPRETAFAAVYWNLGSGKRSGRDAKRTSDVQLDRFWVV